MIQDGKVVIPGVPHYVHQGEWVEFLPVTSMGDLLALLKGLTPENDSAGETTPEVLGARITSRCEWLANQLVAWDWTDLLGAPLPCPHGKPDVLLRLSNDELMWLIGESQSTETETDRKNG